MTRLMIDEHFELIGQFVRIGIGVDRVSDVERG